MTKIDNNMPPIGHTFEPKSIQLNSTGFRVLNGLWKIESKERKKEKKRKERKEKKEKKERKAV